VAWVHGTKLSFFVCRKEDWLRESEAKRSGAFYIKMSKLYVKKYGWHLADDQDLAEDVEDPPDEAANEVVHKVMLEEEKQFCKLYTKNLRIVSRAVFFLKKKRNSSHLGRGLGSGITCSTGIS
jgi:hypothetical protein